MFGCTLGIVPHMAAAIMGLAALLHASAVAFQTFKYLGVAYLLWMAWSALRERGALSVKAEGGAHPQSSLTMDGAGSRGCSATAAARARSRAARRDALQVTVHALLINILNPKLSIFFFAFLPQFVHGDEPHPLRHMLVLSGVFMGLTFVVFVVYGVFAAAVRRHIIARPRVLMWMRRAFAGAFVALGAKLALAER